MSGSPRDTVRLIACPHCKAPVRWEPASRFRPFCSERCRLIDLGAWASERYAIPVSSSLDDPDGLDDSDIADPSAPVSSRQNPLIPITP